MAGPEGGVSADTPAVAAEGGVVFTTGTDLGAAAAHVGRLAVFADAAAETGASDFRSAWSTGLELLGEATRLLGLLAQQGASDLESADVELADQALLLDTAG